MKNLFMACENAVYVKKTNKQTINKQQQQQHQMLYLHDHKGITVLQKLLV